MSESDEDVTVDVDGVSVRKTLNDHQFETLAVVFDIRSGREHPTGVSVRETIPDGVVEDDVGFHPEYGGEHWRLEEGEVVFSRTFEPGEQYTTVFGVRDFDGARADLLGEPAVAVDGAGSGVENIGDLVSEGDSDVVKEVISGERDMLPGAGEPAAAAEEPEAAAEATDTSGPEPAPAGDDAVTAAEGGVDEPDDGTEPIEAPEPPGEVEMAAPADPESAVEEAAEAAAADAGAAPSDEPDAAPSDEVTVPVTGGIARVLAKELRAGNVSYEDRRLLREELLPDDGSTDARIRRLQSQVADLSAYTDALEAFLDEEGGAEAVLADVEDEVASLADDVAAVEGTVEAVSETVQSVEDEVQTVSDDVAAASERTDRLADDVEDLQDGLERIESLGRRIEGLEDDVEAIHDELEDLAAFRDRLSSVFGPGGSGEGGAGPEEDDY